MIVTALSRNHQFRVIQGVGDENKKYPYVVSLGRLQSEVPSQELYRVCTGTLIASEWVITAAHCLIPQLEIVRYGYMFNPRNATESTRKILKRIPYPNFRDFIIHYYEIVQIKNDIGLILVEEIHMMLLGKISAVDYRTLNGQKVTYAGYGRTGERIKNKSLELQESLLDQYKPLQLGESMVLSCPQSDIPDPRFPYEKMNQLPALCAVAKCTMKGHRPAAGDSGGPVFFDDKVVAVVSGGKVINKDDEILYEIHTPVSPYLDWIRATMNTHESAEARRVRRNNVSRAPVSWWP